MASKVIQAAGLDVGSRYTRALACVVEHGRLEFKGCAEVPSQGWANGTIAHQGAASDSIRAALRELEQTSQLQVDEIVVGMGGPAVRGTNGRGHIEFGRPREIEQRDVNRVVERALRFQLPDDRMVLQLCQQDFVVDYHPGHRDPRGMIATDLEINVHLIHASVQEHASLVSAVHQAHMAVEETIFEAVAACHAAVLPHERREGIALLDIGAQSTDMVVYSGDSLQLASTLRMGGDHFTRDVVHGLRIGMEDADLVKEEYGCATAAYTSEKSLVEVPGRDAREARDISRRMLNEIIEARTLDLFRLVWRELERVGMQNALIGGVVLTGGGSKLADICEVAEQVLGCTARKALPIGIQDWPEEIYDPEWTTAAGLAMYSGRLKLQGDRERKTAGLLTRILR